MALFKIFKGTKDGLGAAPNAGEQDTRYAHEGFAYFTRDDGKFYIDIEGSANNTDTLAVIGTNRIPLSADKADNDALGNSITDSYVANVVVSQISPNVLNLLSKAGAVIGSVTIPTMTGASTTTAGTVGFVPAPAAGNNTKFLCGDGTWQSATLVTLKTWTASS